MGEELSSSVRERELKKTGKPELIRLVLSLEAQLEAAKRSIEDTKKEALEAAKDRRIELSEAGSIAEASVRITDVFEEAQKAADTYLFNIRELEERHKEEVDIKMQEAEKEAKRIVTDAEKQADSIIAGAKSEGQRLRREAELESAKREREADKYYENIKERTRSALVNLSRFNEDYERLKKIASQQPDEGMLVVSGGEGEEKNDVGGEDGSIDPQKLYKSVDGMIDAKEKKEAS